MGDARDRKFKVEKDMVSESGHRMDRRTGIVATVSDVTHEVQQYRWKNITALFYSLAWRMEKVNCTST